VSKPAATPIQYFSIPQIREQFLPLCRQSLQKMFIGQPGVVVVGRRENRDPRKCAAGEPLRKHRKLYVPRVVVERVVREMTVT
jgi:hypothetical protein